MILRHTLIYTGVRFLPALASLFALMIFTRLMSPSQFGEYSLTVTVTTTAVAILVNFLIIGLGRFEPAVISEEERSCLHSTVVLAALFISLSLSVSTMLFAWLDYLPDLSVNYYHLASLFQVSVLLLLSQKLMNANLKPARYGVSLALKNTLLLGFGATSLLLGYGVDGVLAGLALASLMASLPGVKLWAKTSIMLFDSRVLRRLWSYGAPLTFLYLFVMIISFSDRIFIDVMLGSSEVGLYSAGYDLTQYTLGVIASILHLAAFPIIVKAYENEGMQRTKELLSTAVRILLLLMVPVTLGFISIKNEVSRLFLGEDFSITTIRLIPFLALAVFLSTIKSYYFDYAFQLTKATWLQMLPPMGAAACNCLLNYYMLSAFGLIGAAYATLMSYFLYLIFAIYLSRKVFELPIFPWGFATKVFASGIIMALVVMHVHADIPTVAELAIKILIGIVVFVTCICFFLGKEFFLMVKEIKLKK